MLKAVSNFYCRQASVRGGICRAAKLAQVTCGEGQSAQETICRVKKIFGRKGKSIA